MSRTLDPAEAAAIAEGEDPGAVPGDVDAGDGDVEASDPAPAAPASNGGGLFGSIGEALLSTEPSRPLATIDDPWNPEEGGTARIYRGIQKITSMDGMPAILDIGIGALELAVEDDVDGAGDVEGDDVVDELEDWDE